MFCRVKSLLFFILLKSVVYAQTADTTSYGISPFNTSTIASLDQPDVLTKPTIGLGIGTLSFWGDVYDKHFQPLNVARIAHELYVSQPINSYLTFNFNVLYGNLGANERFDKNGRNWNFRSRIFLGGINLTYNFEHFLPADRDVSPYISLGVAGFEFHSKTDLFNVKGNRYYYWSDNTIRNMSEADPNAANAIELKRDYIYESDIQSLNLDGSGKYPEFSFSIPVGAGVNFKINNYLNCKLGATLYFTATDHIDGITSKIEGTQAGNKSNDRFLMTSFGINYNFGSKKYQKQFEENSYPFTGENVDFYALENEDQDGDGVIDFLDSCQGTPAGVPVDSKGCPLDDDVDQVPNYKDLELATRADAPVDTNGVELTDSLIAARYRFYMDSTGTFAKVVVHDHNGALIRNPYNEKEYTVELGIFKTGLPPDLMTQFLSINDISTTVLDDSTTAYTAGAFKEKQAAEARKQELINSGLTNIKVVYKQRGRFYDPEQETTIAASTGNNSKSEDNTNKKQEADTQLAHSKINAKENIYTDGKVAKMAIFPADIKTDGIVFRVQLGAYRHKISKNVFPEINDLIQVKTEDSLYKYMTGNHHSIETAAKHKTQLLLKGYEGAFITAYKDGNRIPLQKAGATPINTKEQIKDIPDNQPISGVTKKLVVYKVQIGAFKNTGSSSKFDKLKVVKQSEKGYDKYLTGEFYDYAAALKYRDELLKTNAVNEAFVVAYFNGRIISLQEAAELLKN